MFVPVVAQAANTEETRVSNARWASLAGFVESNGGVLVLAVPELLALADARRAGRLVVESIERELEAHGIGHLPASIPRDRGRSVLLYEKTVAIGLLTEGVRQLSERELSSRRRRGRRQDPGADGAVDAVMPETRHIGVAGTAS